MDSLLIKNARLPEGACGAPFGDVASSGGVITYVGPKFTGSARRVLDAGGELLLPGFVDIHFHGAAGCDFCDADFEGLLSIANRRLAEGVTTAVPATLTLPEGRLRGAFETAARYCGAGSPFCRIPGIHLEGPFINREMAGAQNPEFARAPDIGMVRRLSSAFKILKVSYSPELDPGCSFLRALVEDGIAPSCAHSCAGFAEFERARAFGLRGITHFGNRLGPLSPRDIGALGAGLLFDDVSCEIIADMVHLSCDMLRLVFAKKPLSRIILITDAMRASWMPDGTYSLGGLGVDVRRGEARLVSGGALAGSVLKMNEALRNACAVSGVPPERLWPVSSLNAASSLGIPLTGKIAEGWAADFALLSGDFRVLKTVVAGEVRFCA